MVKDLLSIGIAALGILGGIWAMTAAGETRVTFSLLVFAIPLALAGGLIYLVRKS